MLQHNAAGFQLQMLVGIAKETEICFGIKKPLLNEDTLNLKAWP